MSQLHVGLGRAEITPPVGLDLTGFIMRENPSTFVRDPLWARACLLRTGDTTLLILALDCLSLDPWLYQRLVRLISHELNILPVDISIWCSHTHSGPATLSLHGCGEPDMNYLRGSFEDGVLRAVRQAAHDTTPARARWTLANAETWHNYRRAKDKGPCDEALVDHHVRGLFLTSHEGAPLACLWSFAAHPSVLCDTGFSADWVGAANKLLEQEHGLALFGQGFAGDVAPIRDRRDAQEVDAMGQGIAGALLSALDHAETFDVSSLEAHACNLALPYETIPRPEWFAEHARQRRQEATDATSADARRVALALADWAEHWATHETQPYLKVQLQYVRVGPLRIATVPFEPLSALGHALRAALPEPLMTLGYVNTCHAYLAPASQYPVGGYEVDVAFRFYGLPARYDPTAAGMVIDAMVRLASGSFTQ